MTRVTVVGQGPAALFAASLLREAGHECIIVSDSEGSLPLWSGTFDFHAPVGDVSNPWSLLDTQPISQSGQEWKSLWERLARVEREAGIPVPDSLPSRGLFTITCTGREKPVFMVPAWQYAQEAAQPVWFVGFDGLADSMAAFQCGAYQKHTGVKANYCDIPKPSKWTPTWGAVRWAAYIDSDAGLDWLKRALQTVSPDIPPGWPVLVPQVIGRKFPERNLHALQVATGHPVFEYPLPPPSLGGMRIRDRWVWNLKQSGVQFLAGRVTLAEPTGQISLEDGREWRSDHIIVASGGILGGGLEISVDGTVHDTLRKEVLGSITARQDLQMQEWGRLADDGTPRITTCGAQCRGWNPNRDSNGGALILATVFQSLNREGLVAVGPPGAVSERSLSHVE